MDEFLDSSCKEVMEKFYSKFLTQLLGKTGKDAKNIPRTKRGM